MKIDGVSGSAMQAGQMGMNQASDPVSKSIRKQIADVQKQLQELSSNKDISMEEKMKKRQELQQQISDLNNQLRQHQIELRKEKQQQKTSSMDDMVSKNEKAETAGGNPQAAGISAAGMSAMISADSSIKQAKVEGSVATRMEGRAGVLKAEIKLDGQRGGDASAKETELAEVEQKAENAAADQLNTLAEANKEMKDAAQADNAAQAERQDSVKKAEPGENAETDKVSAPQERALEDNDANASDSANAASVMSARGQHTSVDIRL